MSENKKNITTDVVTDINDVKNQVNAEIDKSIKEKQSSLNELEKGMKNLNKNKNSTIYKTLKSQVESLKNEIKKLKNQKKEMTNILHKVTEMDEDELGLEPFINFNNTINIKLIIRGLLITCIFLLLVTKSVRNKLLSLFVINKSNYLYLAMVFIFISYLLIHLF